jgi:hypothetical protein
MDEQVILTSSLEADYFGLNGIQYWNFVSQVGTSFPLSYLGSEAPSLVHICITHHCLLHPVHGQQAHCVSWRLGSWISALTIPPQCTLEIHVCCSHVLCAHAVSLRRSHLMSYQRSSSGRSAISCYGVRYCYHCRCLANTEGLAGH